MKLRPYQTKAVADTRAAFSRKIRRVLIVKPTGSGKTVTFSDITLKATNKGATVMILCDRKELIKQAYDKVFALGLVPTIIAPGFRQTESNTYLASNDTLRRRELPKIDILIIDEAHKQSFDKTIHRYIEHCNPLIIGATATPLRTGNQNCLSTIYEEIIEPVTIGELLDDGYLAPARTFAAKEDFSDVKKRGQDFDMAALYSKFDDSVLYDGVVDNWRKFANGKKAICFNVNVEHSKKMCQTFNEAGISARHIDGKTPTAERRETQEAFTRGDFLILCNCGVLTTGYDEPSIECVIVNRATLSLPLWLQMTGRGSRTYEGKQNFIILDQGGNAKRHGLWEEDREWSLYKKKKQKSDGVAPIKVCDSCEALNHASARVCKECGTPFIIKEKKLKVSEFIEVKSNRGASRGSSNKKEEDLKKYAKSMGYHAGWVKHQLNKVE